MMDKNQSQQAGDNAQQTQYENCSITVINGIDEKRAREISLEVFNTLRKELTNEAFETAKKRVQKLENVLIPRIQKIDEAFNAFSDPAFQYTLYKAQKSAAKTERPADYELLSELLIRRIEKGFDRNIRAGINKAVEIVDDLSDEALLGLTVSFFMEQFTPTNGIISEGLDYFDKILQAISYDKLPTESEWIDNLDVLGAVRMSVSSTTSRISYEDYFSENTTGYWSVGIKKGSENHSKAIAMLNEVSIDTPFLYDHELNPSYVRLPVSNEKIIDNFSFITDKQKKVLHEIFSMYENNNQLLQKTIKRNLYTELEARQYLNDARQWWNNLPIFYKITSVGKNVAYANAQRICPDLPPLK